MKSSGSFSSSGWSAKRKEDLTMASIVQRNNRYCVVYLYDDETSGRRRQKWESFRTMADAKKRKAEIEYRQELGTLVIHKCQTIDELLNEYVALYGKATWSISMYTSNIALMKHDLGIPSLICEIRIIKFSH